MRRPGDHLNQRNRATTLFKEIDDMVGHGLFIIRRHWLWFATYHRNPLGVGGPCDFTSGSGVCGRRSPERVLLHLVQGYFDAESFDSSATASCTVVMNCAGKMMVEFFSIEISAIVCRVRSCSATGCCEMMSAAWPSFTAAWYSPSAATILARRSRSASASLAMARCILSGSTMSLISTAVTWVPHGSVWPSMTFLICSLMLAVSESS